MRTNTSAGPTTRQKNPVTRGVNLWAGTAAACSTPETPAFRRMTNLKTLARLDHAAIRVAGRRRVETQRQRLAMLSRDRRAVELVKEARLAAWKEEQKRGEAAMLDDLSVMRAGTPRREVA